MEPRKDRQHHLRKRMTVRSTPRLVREPLYAPHLVRAGRHLSAGWLIALLCVFALAPRAAVATPAALFADNTATSSVVPCLQVGSAYLGSSTTPNVYQQDVYLSWTGTITSARLIGYEFNANSIKGHLIKVNGVLIGRATGQRNTETQCRGFEGRQPLSWTIDNPAILNNGGRNTLRIEIDPGLTDDTSWGISRAQIEVSGIGVDGRHFSQVTITSSYFNNWGSYQNEGTWTHIMTPPGYTGATPAPLLVAAHGFGSTGGEVLAEYQDAAAVRGWLVASADYHGEVWNHFYEADYATGLPRPGVGKRTLGSRASQWDILDILKYMQDNYNVDPTRIYLVGHSMGGMTALLAGARWADRFAAVVSDSSPTDLIDWEDETNPDPADPGATPNTSVNFAIRTETGTFSQPNHAPAQQRVPADYPFEYERRSPVRWAANYQHLPLWILHPESDVTVLPRHAEDLYRRVLLTNPDHVERKYFPGVHNDRIDGAGFAETQLAWLSQFSRQPDEAPAELNFVVDWAGEPKPGEEPWSHFWISAQMSDASLSEAHWLRVSGARYSRADRTIEAAVENLKPQSGDASTLGVPAPKNMAVTLTFDLARIGLPESGPYAVERVNKDDGSFLQTYPSAADGKLQVIVPQGSYLFKLTAGGQVPNTQVLSLRQGTGGYGGAQDTYLSAWAPTTNFATAPNLVLRVNGDAPNHAALLRFDLAPLPPNAAIRFATLSVSMTGYPSVAVPLSVDALVRPWQASAATWLKADASTAWTEPGAGRVPDDRAGLAPDLRMIYPTAQIADRYGFDVTQIVRDWASNPATNQGLILRVDMMDGLYGPTWTGMSIASAEGGTSDRRPLLTVIYTLDLPTPTPTPTLTPTPTATATPPVGQIEGVVFLDVDRDGVHAAGEAVLSGRLVQLVREGVIKDNVTTDANGLYRFGAVLPGEWEVALVAPANYQVTTAAGNPAPATVTEGSVTTVDFGIAYGTPTPTVTPPPDRVRTFLPLILRGE